MISDSEYAQRCENNRNYERLKVERERIKAVREQTAEFRALRVAVEALLACLAAGGETETPPDEDAWKLTYERIDFAPIWSRADFEKRAREWLAESPPEGTKP